MSHQIFGFWANILLVCCLAFAEEHVTDEILDLSGWWETSERHKVQPMLSNSATQFLLEVYKEISEEDDQGLPEYFYNIYKAHDKRSLETFVTSFDRREIELCNNIMTFASRPTALNSNSALFGDMFLNFNLNDIPNDLELTHAVLRLYQEPLLGVFSSDDMASEIYTFTISLYQPVGEYMLFVASTDTTSDFRGWVELNATALLSNWIYFRTFQEALFGHQLLIGVTLHKPLEGTANIVHQPIAAADVGLVSAHIDSDGPDLHPFIIGYFNGPDLMTKVQDRLESIREDRKSDLLKYKGPPYQSYEQAAEAEPRPCQRHSFTLDFSFLGIENTVIAPDSFATYFCYGECNFPLSTSLSNSTNHAIVQTLIHLSKPNLPRPACVPTKLSSISILHAVNEDSSNLMRFSQIVAKECGCR